MAIVNEISEVLVVTIGEGVVKRKRVPLLVGALWSPKIPFV